MDDVLIFLAGILCAAVFYLIATVRRHESALQFFQEKLQNDDKVITPATWGGLNGDDE